MRETALAALGLAMFLPAVAALAQHRELGAHEHGRGTLNIALEGKRLSLELEAPGVDIVGFEHPAKSGKDRAAVEAAIKRLSAPLTLFKLSATAGCVVKEAKADLEGEHDHDQDYGKSGKGEPGKEAAAHEEHEHAQFHAQYMLDCRAPEKIAAIEFEYFRAFAGAQKLDVNLITGKGQSRLEVTRARPRLDLAGKM